MKTSFEDHLKEDRLGLEGAMSAAPAKIVASVFKIINSRILVGEMIALDQWELLPIWELLLPVISGLQWVLAHRIFESRKIKKVKLGS